MMASRTRLAGSDDDDPPLRPAWDETEDETDIDLRRSSRARRKLAVHNAFYRHPELAPSVLLSAPGSKTTK